MSGQKRHLAAYLTAFLTVLLTLAMVRYPKEAFDASVAGLEVWWHIVFPALMLFFVFAQILVGLGVVHLMGVFLEPVMRPLFNVPGTGSFVMAMGLASGFPRCGLSVYCGLARGFHAGENNSLQHDHRIQRSLGPCAGGQYHCRHRYPHQPIYCFAAGACASSGALYGGAAWAGGENFRPAGRPCFSANGACRQLLFLVEPDRLYAEPDAFFLCSFGRFGCCSIYCQSHPSNALFQPAPQIALSGR